MQNENRRKIRILDVQTYETVENLKVIPDYSNLSVSVKIPMPGENLIRMSKDIDAAENTYIQLRDKTQLEKEKIAYDRARAVCKWAKACNAILKGQIVESGEMTFKFNFTSLDELKAFTADAYGNIESSSKSR